MKVADKAPTYCSACFNQNAELKHVDFDAFWDGPTLDTEGSIKVTIDDLVLCENCLKAAAGLVGMVDNKGMRKENFELGQALEEKNIQIEIYRKALSDLEHTLGLTLSGNLKRGSGRPQIRIPENLEEIVRESLLQKAAA